MHESEFDKFKNEVNHMLKGFRAMINQEEDCLGVASRVESEKINQETGLGLRVTIEVCKIEDAYLQGETK